MNVFHGFSRRQILKWASGAIVGSVATHAWSDDTASNALSSTQPPFDSDKTGAQANRERLVRAYPGSLSNATDDGVVWSDGEVSVWGNPRPLIDLDKRIASATLFDQMSIPYPKGPITERPKLNSDPGRLRNAAFFRKMYGQNAEEVQRHLELVEWSFGGHSAELPMTRVNGVSAALRKVTSQLIQLPGSYARYLQPSAGSFNWRKVAGADELSPHSFGIALDIALKYSDYWRWEQPYRWRNRIPYGIVEIFERNGFIWGGKWYHYDTMHFEYRPELL
jgi:hypothetical protein